MKTLSLPKIPERTLDERVYIQQGSPAVPTFKNPSGMKSDPEYLTQVPPRDHLCSARPGTMFK